jgi:hypothetical protein
MLTYTISSLQKRMTNALLAYLRPFIQFLAEFSLQSSACRATADNLSSLFGSAGIGAENIESARYGRQM